MATETVNDAPAARTRVAKELRVCRSHMLASAGVLDTEGETEAVHSLRLSLTTLDDCLDALESRHTCPLCGGINGHHTACPKVLAGTSAERPYRRPTIADDVAMDRQMDADRSDV